MTNKKLKIAYLYPENLNLYGDAGNVEILVYRAKNRGIEVEVNEISIHDSVAKINVRDIDIIVMGGGPDAQQREMYLDFLNNKKTFMSDYIANNGFGLYICGSYQLLGKYYKSATGEYIEGLAIFDLYTEHFGKFKTRCIGNLNVKISPVLLQNELFKKINTFGDTLVGFENHGGRTYLGTPDLALGKVLHGYGNNGEDGTEGFLYKNSFGTYLHGPILSKNPHIADYLIAGSLQIDTLVALPHNFDTIVATAHKKRLTAK